MIDARQIRAISNSRSRYPGKNSPPIKEGCIRPNVSRRSSSASSLENGAVQFIQPIGLPIVADHPLAIFAFHIAQDGCDWAGISSAPTARWTKSIVDRRITLHPLLKFPDRPSYANTKCLKVQKPASIQTKYRRSGTRFESDCVSAVSMNRLSNNQPMLQRVNKIGGTGSSKKIWIGLWTRDARWFRIAGK